MKSTEQPQFLSPSIEGVVDSVSVGSSSGTESQWWKRAGRFLFVLALVGAVIYAGNWALSRRGGAQMNGQAFAKVVRGDLEITVLEGGNVNALESLELKSQVQAREGAKILSIVEEGYEVTAEDVKAEKILIKLDPTEMNEKIESHDIEFQNAETGFTETDEERSIQAAESQNDIKLIRQTARFALLDLEKYLGEETSGNVLAMRSLPWNQDTLLTYEDKFRDRLMVGKIKGDTKSQREIRGSVNELIINREEVVRIDFAKFLAEDKLGDGEAQQELRKLQNEFLLAKSELAVVAETVLGSERLAEKSFITKASLEKEKVSLEKAQVKELSAKTQLELFRRYEFTKKAEEFLTKYEDALHKLDREKKEALAKMSQAEAKFRSASQMFKMATRKRDQLAEQLESCTIVATKPGLVVYGGSSRSRSFGGSSSQEKIEEGASVRYKQTMITIPDMRRMAVSVSIQESQIKKVKIGQKVRITTDAEADKILFGEVKKVSVLPDSSRWYENPNQKIYPTKIHIDKTHDWIKPGMSAKVEIVIETLKDVMRIPLQSVMVESGETVVYVNRDGKAVRQVIKGGNFNEDFIEVTEGLTEGESVYLSKPAFDDSNPEDSKAESKASL